METIDIRGVSTRIWKNAPPNLAIVAQFARGHGERIFTIYEEERVSYDAHFRAVANLATRLRKMGVEKGDGSRSRCATCPNGR